jgi:carbon monoxide dehydrogenase subunit G
MKLSGEFAVPARRELVFERLTNAPFFASCIEGTSDLVEVDPTHYTAKLETRIAYIKFKFAVAIEMVERTPPERVVAKAEGKPLGLVGRLTATASANLFDAGEQTRVGYEIDVALAGKLGSIGQPVLKAKAKSMEKSFVQNLNNAFQQPGAASEATHEGI